MTKHHQPRRLAAAARHAEQQAHPELRDAIFVEDLDLDAAVGRRAPRHAAQIPAASARCPARWRARAPDCCIRRAAGRDRPRRARGRRTSRACSGSATVHAGASGGAGSPVLYMPTLNSDSVSPSATACASSTRRRRGRAARTRPAPARRFRAESPAGGGQLPRQLAPVRRPTVPRRRAAADGPASRGRRARWRTARTSCRRIPSTRSARAISPPLAASSPSTDRGPLVFEPRDDEQIGVHRRKRRGYAGDRSERPSSKASRIIADALAGAQGAATMNAGLPASARRIIDEQHLRGTIPAGVTCLAVAATGLDGRRPAQGEIPARSCRSRRSRTSASRPRASC